MRHELITQAMVFFGISALVFIIAGTYYSAFIKKHDSELDKNKYTFKTFVLCILAAAAGGITNYVYKSTEDTILKNEETERLQLKATELNDKLAIIKIEQVERTLYTDDNKSEFDTYNKSDLRNAQARFSAELSEVNDKLSDLNRGKYGINDGKLYYLTRVAK